MAAAEGYGDGEFQLPTDVAIDKQGFIYVSEHNGNDRVTKWSPSYEFVSRMCGRDRRRGHAATGCDGYR
ncbi:MAG: hypothetical protein R3E58_18980 [Phycisphaerae bacterium]